MDSCVTERDDGSGSVGIKLIQKRKLLVADDALSLLWSILEAREANKKIRRNAAFEPRNPADRLDTPNRYRPRHQEEVRVRQ